MTLRYLVRENAELDAKLGSTHYVEKDVTGKLTEEVNTGRFRQRFEKDIRARNEANKKREREEDLQRDQALGANTMMIWKKIHELSEKIVTLQKQVDVVVDTMDVVSNVIEDNLKYNTTKLTEAEKILETEETSEEESEIEDEPVREVEVKRLSASQIKRFATKTKEEIKNEYRIYLQYQEPPPTKPDYYFVEQAPKVQHTKGYFNIGSFRKSDFEDVRYAHDTISAHTPQGLRRKRWYFLKSGLYLYEIYRSQSPIAHRIEPHGIEDLLSTKSTQVFVERNVELAKDACWQLPTIALLRLDTMDLPSMSEAAYEALGERMTTEDRNLKKFGFMEGKEMTAWKVYLLGMDLRRILEKGALDAELDYFDKFGMSDLMYFREKIETRYRTYLQPLLQHKYLNSGDKTILIRFVEEIMTKINNEKDRLLNGFTIRSIVAQGLFSWLSGKTEVEHLDSVIDSQTEEPTPKKSFWESFTLTHKVDEKTGKLLQQLIDILSGGKTSITDSGKFLATVPGMFGYSFEDIVNGVILIMVVARNMWLATSVGHMVTIFVQFLLGLGLSTVGLMRFLGEKLARFFECLYIFLFRHKKEPSPVSIQLEKPPIEGHIEEEDRILEEATKELCDTGMDVIAHGVFGVDPTTIHKQKMLGNDILGYMKNVTQIKSFTQAVEYLINLGWKLTSATYYWIWDTPLMTSKTTQAVHDAQAWMEEAVRLLDVQDPEKITNDPAIAAQYVLHYEKVLPLQKTIIEYGYTHANFSPFFAAVGSFKLLVDAIKANTRGAKPRVPPVYIDIAGPPGVGKSTITSVLIRDCYIDHCNRKGISPDRSGKTLFFERKEENEYWDGYANHFAVKEDDQFQNEDKEVITRTMLEMICMCNTNPYPLHMASVEAKKDSYFDSRLIVTTRNVKTNNLHSGKIPLPPNNLNDADAYRRRRDFLVEMRVKKEYGYDPGNGFLKLKPGLEPSHQYNEFRLYDTMRECPRKVGDGEKEWIDYETLLSYLLYTLQVREKDLNTWQTFLRQDPIKVTPKPVPGTIYGHMTQENEDLTVKGEGEDLTVKEAAEILKENISVIEDSNKIVDQIYMEIYPEDKTELRNLPAVKERRGHISGTPIVDEPKFTRKDMLVVFRLLLDSHNKVIMPGDCIYNLRKYTHPKDEWCDTRHYKFDLVYLHEGKWYRRDNVIAIATEIEDRTYTYGPDGQFDVIYRDTFRIQFTRATHSIGHSFVAFTKRIGELLKQRSTVLFLIAGFVVLSSMVAYVRFCTNITSEFDVEPQAAPPIGVSRAPSGGIKTTKRGQKQEVQRKLRGTIHSHSTNEDQAVRDLCMGPLKRNMRKITVSDFEDQPGFSMYGFFIEGRVFTTAQHLLTALKKNEKGEYEGYVKLTNMDGQTKSWPMKSIYYLCDDENDQVWFLFPNNCQPSKSIIEHFITQHDLKNANISSTTFFKCDPEKGVEFRHSSTTFIGESATYPVGTGFATVSHLIEYGHSSNKGECGCPSVVNNNKIRGKIIALHTGGGTGFGIGVQQTREVNQEAFEQLMKIEEEHLKEQQLKIESTEINPHFVEEEGFIDKNNTRPPLFDYGVNEFIGKCDGKYLHRISDKSEIVPSLIQGKLSQPISAPATLSKIVDEEGNILSPMQNVINNYTKVEDPYVLEKEFEEAIKEELTQCTPALFPPKNFTEKESINGDPTAQYFGPMHQNTSAGNNPGLAKPVGAKGKRYCFEETGELTQDGVPVLQMRAEVLERYNARLKAYREKRTGQCITEINLKDERRTMAKVLKALTRGFGTQEVHNTIIGRRVFGAWMENIMLNWKKTGVTIGINPASDDWREVGKPLGDWLLFSGDYAKSDYAHKRAIDELILEWSIEWYRETCKQYGVEFTQDWENEMRGVASDALFTIFIKIVNDIVRLRGNYLVSGFFATALWNSLHFYIALRLAFYTGAKDLLSKFKNGNIDELKKILFLGIDDEKQQMEIYEKFKNTMLEIEDELLSRQWLRSIKTRTNGDDFLMFILSKFSWFNFNTLIYYSAKLGYTITPAEKTAQPKPFYTLSEVQYLKRGFRDEMGITFAPIELKELLEVLNWVRVGLDPREALHLNAEWVIQELFHHGREVFDLWKKKINHELVRVGIQPINTTYNYFLFKYMGVENNLVRNREIDAHGIKEGMDVTSLRHLYQMVYHKIVDFSVMQLGSHFVAQFNVDGGIFAGRATTKDEAKELALEQFFTFYGNISRERAWVHGDPNSYVTLGELQPEVQKRVDKILSGLGTKDYYAFKEEVKEEKKEELPAKVSEFKVEINNNNQQQLEDERPVYAFTTPDIKDRAFQMLRNIEDIEAEYFPINHVGNPQYARLYHALAPLIDELVHIPTHEEDRLDVLENLEELVKILGRAEDKWRKTPRKSKYDYTKIIPHMLEPSAETEAPSQQRMALTTIEDASPPVIVPETAVGKFAHFLRGTDPFPDMGLKQVLERQYQIATYSWDSTDVEGVNIITPLNFPYALLQASANLREKMNRNHYFRADVEVEVRINGLLYNYGELLIASQPYCKGVTNNWKFSNIYTMSTMNPHIISPQTTESVKILIPFINKNAWLTDDKWTADVGHIGTLLGKVFTPLKLQNDNNTSTVSVVVFARFVNAEIAGPTLHTISGHMKKEQVAQSKSGLLTSALGFVKGISSIAKTIPAVSGVATGVETAATLGQGISSMLGLDKPNSVKATQPVVQRTATSLSNGKGIDETQELGLDPDNKVSNEPRDYRLDVQETDFKSMSQKPGLFYKSSFDATDTAGKLLYKWHITPMTCNVRYDAGPGDFYALMTPCGIVGYMHKQWNGDMHYCLIFECTQLHTAKLRISYHPTQAEIPSTFTTESGDYISKIIDIRGRKVFRFSVQYLADTLFKNCEDFWTKTSEGYAGMLALSIVTPVPSVGVVTADTTIYYSIWCAAGPNMTYHTPWSRGINRVLSTNATTLPPGTIVAQGDGMEQTSNIEELFRGSFEPLIPATNHKTMKLCFGEENTNVLDLLHRYQFYEKILMTENTNYIKKYPPLVTVGLLQLPSDCTYHLVLNSFLFSRGGDNYKLFKTQNNSNASNDGMLHAFPVYDGSDISDDSLIFGRAGLVIEDMHIHPCLDASLPYVSRYPYEADENVCVNEGEEVTKIAFLYKSYLSGGGNKTPTLLMGAVKDDKSFGWFCGMPILWLPGSSEEEAPKDTNNNSTLRAIALSNTTFSLDTNNKNNKKTVRD